MNICPCYEVLKLVESPGLRLGSSAFELHRTPRSSALLPPPSPSPSPSPSSSSSSSSFPRWFLFWDDFRDGRHGAWLNARLRYEYLLLCVLRTEYEAVDAGSVAVPVETAEDVAAAEAVQTARCVAVQHVIVLSFHRLTNYSN